MKIRNLAQFVALVFSVPVFAGPFSIPADLNKSTLPTAVNNYATQVLTCLHVEPEDMTEGQKAWLCERGANTQCIYNEIYNVAPPITLAQLQAKRDAVCQTVFEKLVDKDYCGLQYGNCGEGSMTNYCMAHKAGYKDVMSCSSENDHAFAMFLKKGSSPDKDTICVMDRWPLGPSKEENPNLGEGQYYFCDASLVDGKIYHKGKLLSGRKWYDKVSCGDWANEHKNEFAPSFKNLNVEVWKKQFLAENNIVSSRAVCHLMGLGRDCPIKKVGHIANVGSGRVKILIDVAKLRPTFAKELKAKIKDSIAKSGIQNVKVHRAFMGPMEIEVEKAEDFIRIISTR